MKDGWMDGSCCLNQDREMELHDGEAGGKVFIKVSILTGGEE